MTFQRELLEEGEWKLRLGSYDPSDGRGGSGVLAVMSTEGWEGLWLAVEQWASFPRQLAFYMHPSHLSGCTVIC